MTEKATLEDLAKAEAELARWKEKWDNYSGNNPDKYQASIRSARRRAAEVTAELKANGLLPRTPQEELEARLDAAFPNAQSRQVVEFEGERYMRRFYPAEKSRSGKTVTGWNKAWERVPA